MKKEREEEFLFSSFIEFNKCWRSGTKARVIMESFNGVAFVNFTAFLGHPDDVHFDSRPAEQKPPKKPRKKSDKKVERDNERAAQFQKRKRKEEEEAASDSKPTNKSAAPMQGKFEFIFASPAQEDLSNLSTSSRADSQENLRKNSEEDDSMVDIQSTLNTNPEDEDDLSLNISLPEEEISITNCYEDSKMTPEEDNQSSSTDNETNEVEDTDEESCNNVGEQIIDVEDLLTQDDPRIVRYFIHRTGLSKHFLQSFKMNHKGHGLSSHIIERDLGCFTKHEKELIDKAYDYFEDLLAQDARGEYNIQLEGDEWSSTTMTTKQIF